ncbi:hypothetical protein Bpfe_021113 [Biomphalaria pfeifferi]|uniref:Uncharacterized protein n=1 Tax=Biomphalaria pfeifferi TaxID=112525 RepID=A0AAD8F3W9_BIOPF|nr:hypothetical protein Bpfe_021113 [Biomphalaria pfeifferi]
MAGEKTINSQKKVCEGKFQPEIKELPPLEEYVRPPCPGSEKTEGSAPASPKAKAKTDPKAPKSPSVKSPASKAAGKGTK